jgi:hypothetical protein
VVRLTDFDHILIAYIYQTTISSRSATTPEFQPRYRNALTMDLEIVLALRPSCDRDRCRLYIPDTLAPKFWPFMQPFNAKFRRVCLVLDNNKLKHFTRTSAAFDSYHAKMRPHSAFVVRLQIPSLGSAPPLPDICDDQMRILFFFCRS